MEEKSFVFKLGPIWFDGTVCLMIFLTCLIVFLFAFIASRKITMKPKGGQNVMEYVIDFVRNILSDNLPKDEISNLHLFAFVLFLFIFVSNVIGLMTKVVLPDETTLWKSPTADPFVTLTLAMTIILISNFLGLQKFGVKGYVINSYFKPIAMIAPIKLMEEFTNVLTLSLRLYGNIYAGEVLLTLVAQLAMVKPPFGFILALPLEMIWIGFSVFIGGLQAYIFLTLSSVYISHKVELAE